MSLKKLPRRSFLKTITGGVAAAAGVSVPDLHGYGFELESKIELPNGQKDYLSSRAGWIDIAAVRELRNRFVAEGRMSRHILHEMNESLHRSVYFFTTEKDARDWARKVDSLYRQTDGRALGYAFSREIRPRSQNPVMTQTLFFTENFS
jgi:hypothetical protein